MSAFALRQLGIAGLKQVYRLDAPELCNALQEAARRKIADPKVWDALLYRAALLRAELRPVDLALTVDALAKARRREEGLLQYLMQEVRAKARRFVVRDVALLLNAFAKLAVRDELLTAALIPAVLRRVSEKTRWDDLALLALSFTRLGDPAREPVFDRVVAVAMPRIEMLNDGHTLSLLACAFTRPPPSEKAANRGAAEPLFAGDLLQLESGSVGRGGGGFHSDDGELVINGAAGGSSSAERDELAGNLAADLEEGGHIAHLPFIEVLLAQCERHMWNFRGADLLHLCLALSILSRRGHEALFPPRLLKRLERRMESLYFELLPAQFVRLLEVVAHLPELERSCAAKLLDEVAYRMRDVTPVSCLSVLRTVARVGGHPRAHSAAAWRLARDDAAAKLSAAQVCEAAEVFLGLEPVLWEAREALLILLQGLQRRRVEPEPALLSRMLRAYGELSVRDTHWFHVCRTLCVVDLAGPPPAPSRRGPASSAAALGERAAADALFAMAQLNLPQLVDATALFTRAAAAVASPDAAASALEAAAIFDLMDRRPQELLRPKALAPFVAAVQAAQEAPDGAELPARLRLFPFTRAAAVACKPDVLAAWQAAAKRRHAVPRGADAFELALARELSSWRGAGLVTSVAVGPLCVPWALSLVGLAAHLQEYPLDGLGGTSGGMGHGVVEEAWEAPSDGGADEDADEEAEGEASRPAGRRSRRGGGGGGAAAGQRSSGRRTGGSARSLQSDSAARPETHVLVLPLRDKDFYHASAAIRGERQRAKKQLLGAQRYAELSLLRRAGWRVCTVPERLWTWGPEGDVATSAANRQLVFRLIAGVGEGGEGE